MLAPGALGLFPNEPIPLSLEEGCELDHYARVLLGLAFCKVIDWIVTDAGAIPGCALAAPRRSICKSKLCSRRQLRQRRRRTDGHRQRGVGHDIKVPATSLIAHCQVRSLYFGVTVLEQRHRSQ